MSGMALASQQHAVVMTVAILVLLFLALLTLFGPLLRLLRGVHDQTSFDTVTPLNFRFAGDQSRWPLPVVARWWSLVERRSSYGRFVTPADDRAMPQSLPLPAVTIGYPARRFYEATSGGTTSSTSRLSWTTGRARSLLRKWAGNGAGSGNHYQDRVPTRSAARRVEAVFGFGDSYIDGGNNKFIAGSGFTATYPPYGQDYIPLSGRSSNGKMLLDVIALHLGLPVPPVSLQPDADFSQGINYGSAGAATRDFPYLKGQVLSMWDQLLAFKKVTELVAANTNDPHLPSEAAIQSALYVICFPDNDLNSVVLKYFSSSSAPNPNPSLDPDAPSALTGSNTSPQAKASLLLLRLCDLRGASFCSSLLLQSASLPEHRLQRLLTRELTRALPLLHHTDTGNGYTGSGSGSGSNVLSSSLSWQSKSSISSAADVFAAVPQLQGIVRDLVNTSYQMATNISDAVEFLYPLGARRFLVVKTHAIGCMPYVRSFYPKPFPPHCVQVANAVALAVNKIFMKVLRRTRRKHRDAAIFEFKWFDLWQTAFSRPQAMGFKSHDPCCTGAVVNGTAVSMGCGTNYTMPDGNVVQSYVCPDVEAHFFWDVFHPSQSGFEKIVSMLFDDSPLAVSPRGFKKEMGAA